MVFRVDLRLRPEGRSGRDLQLAGGGRALLRDLRPHLGAAGAAAGPPLGGRPGAGRGVPARWSSPSCTRARSGPRRSTRCWPCGGCSATQAGRAAAGFDVKLGAGGIRDVELVAQLLQLLHAGKRADLRERSTLRALHKLTLAGLLTDREQRALAEAYQFLRRVEHRMQLEHGSQTHSPARRAGRARAAGAPAGLSRRAAPSRPIWSGTCAVVSAISDTLGEPVSAPAGGGAAPAGSRLAPRARSRPTCARPAFTTSPAAPTRSSRCRTGCPPPG